MTVKELIVHLQSLNVPNMKIGVWNNEDGNVLYEFPIVKITDSSTNEEIILLG